MLNPFAYHSNPDKLTGFDDKNNIIPELAYDYALNVIHDEWPKGEHIILKDLDIALEYTEHVRKRRWPELEHIILKDNYFNVRYAISVFKGRWPEAEPFIIKDKFATQKYIRFIEKYYPDSVNKSIDSWNKFKNKAL